MSETLGKRFTAEEMAAIRDSLDDEERFGRRLFALLARVARRIPFAGDAVAVWFCARDPETPTRVRVTLMAALGYFVLPIDAIPDILPVLGFTDDAAVIAAAVAAVAGAIKPRHREAARAWLARR